MKTTLKSSSNDIKILIREIKRLGKMDRCRIVKIYFWDFIESILISVNPLIIGKCIDGLINKKCLGVIILILTELGYMIESARHRYLETKSYSFIVERESCQYFNREVECGEDTSTISSRLDIIDDIPNFILAGIPEVVSCILGTIIVAFMLWYYAGLITFIIALVVSVFIFVLTRKEKQDKFINYKELKSNDEKRENYIEQKDLNNYSSLIKKSMSLFVVDSNLDVKLFIKTYLPQFILLILVIIITVVNGDYTVGLIFSIISYVQMLNDGVDDINDISITIKDLAETAVRLYGNDVGKI